VIGRIIRTISIKEEKPTLQEVELMDLRAIMAGWEMLNLGLWTNTRQGPLSGLIRVRR
jgi:hypothetical protein